MKRARPYPKGRQVDPTALEQVRGLLGFGAHQRDRLIEHLHLIEDAFGHISAPHIRALAFEMAIGEAEVFEVASFYAHFHVTKDPQPGPPKLTVRVCQSLPCAMAGAEHLLDDLIARYAGASELRVEAAPCMGRCAQAPVAQVGKRSVDAATGQSVAQTIDDGQITPSLPQPQSLADYQNQGGYATVIGLRAGGRSADDCQNQLGQAGLRGMGGAGFPANQKWTFVRAEDGPRYVVVNADEGEPGTFKDRHFLETEPHRVLEGALIAAWAVEAEQVFVYLRDEYPALHTILNHEIARLEANDLCPPGFIELRRGAGAYVCGEESALIESIEGKRGLPRHRPPYVAQVGLFGRPTLVHNVETLYWVARILSGDKTFAQAGRNGSQGLRTFSVSGRVASPGVKVAPAGITLNQLITEYCGGMAEGHSLAAYLPGGASGGILPASLADEPLDFGTLEKHGAFIGSAAIIVLSQKDDLLQCALNLMAFFEDEPCGQCTPCRLGTEKAHELLANPAAYHDELVALCDVMADASICGLGQAAPNPIRSLFRHFPQVTGQ